MMDVKKKSGENDESKFTVWHFLQEKVILQTINDDASREDEENSCMLDGIRMQIVGTML